MNILSATIIGTALANYRKAKKTYEEAVRNAESENNAYLAAIEQYNNSKWDKLDQYERNLYDPNVVCEDILVIPILNVGDLVGNKCKVQPKLIIQNISQNRTVEIEHGLAYAMSLYGAESVGALNCPYKIVLAPSQRCTITCPVFEMMEAGKITKDNFLQSLTDYLATKLSGGTLEKTPELERLQEAFVHTLPVGYARIKSDIALVKKGTVIGGNVLTASVSFNYCTNENKDIRRAFYENIKGSCVYQGEAFYPESKWEIN